MGHQICSHQEVYTRYALSWYGLAALSSWRSDNNEKEEREGFRSDYMLHCM